MMRICIHQPDFLPYLGFFHRLLAVDVFVILDDVQFLRRGWHHRDKIKSRTGERWLSLSVKKGDYDQHINQVILADNREIWIEKNLNLLKESYSPAPYFKACFDDLEKIYARDDAYLVDLNMAFLKFCFEQFDVKRELVLSSELGVEGVRNSKLVNLVKAVGGTHYISGMGARSYLDEQAFVDDGISVEWHEFKHPVYPQHHGPFVPGLSCVDLLFNCGPDSKGVLRSCETEG